MKRTDAVTRAFTRIPLDFAPAMAAFNGPRQDAIAGDAHLGEVAAVAFVASVACARARARQSAKVASRCVARHFARVDDRGRVEVRPGARADRRALVRSASRTRVALAARRS